MTLYNVLPYIVSNYRKRFPDIEINLLEQDSPQLEQMIVNEDVDVGIIATYGLKLDSLKYDSIYTDTAVIALPKKHPLSNNKVVNLTDFSNERFLVSSRNARTQAYDYFISTCNLSGFTPHIIQ